MIVLLGLSDLRLRGISYSRVHLDRLIKTGGFPPPLKLGKGKNFWIAAEIDAFIKSRMKERDRKLAAAIREESAA